MNILLLFFAIPVAIIILAAIFETFIHCPLKIAGITFAIFLIVAFAFFDATFLIFVIAYTLLAYITAWIVKEWSCRKHNFQTIEDLISEANAINECNNSINNNNSNCGCRRRYR